MNLNRYRELEADESLPFTEEEFAAGWHSCPDWDFLIVGPETDWGNATVCEIPCQWCGHAPRMKEANNDPNP